MAKHQHDVLSNLLTASFRGVVFDAERAEMEVGHATVVHTYPDRDGGRVENLGRDPVVYSFRIPFLRSLDVEHYPNRWRAFLAAFSDGSTGSLVHPELGEVRVKPNGKLKTTWEADKRAGCWVDVVFVESDEDGEAFARSIKKKAPYFLVEQRAAAARGTLTALENGPDEDLFDKLDDAVALLRKVSGAIDLARMSVDNVFAAVGAVVSAANSIMTAVEKTWDPKAYPGLLALAELVNGAADQANEIAGKTITTRRIPRDMPVEAAARFVGAALDEFLRFNASLAEGTVRAGTVVFVGK